MLSSEVVISADPCTSGDIRLWGGKTDHEGNIEICSAHGVWSAVSDSSWSSAGAVVACRQLGRTGTSEDQPNNIFSAGSLNRRCTVVFSYNFG